MQLLAAYEGMRQLFIKNILIHVPKMNKVLQGWNNMKVSDRIFIFGRTNSLNYLYTDL